MAELKTRKTRASVQAFLKKAAKGERYEACLFLLETFERATKEKAAMWGNAIVGVGSETMTYANGAQLDWPIGGFSPRVQNIAVYGMKAAPRHAALMKRIGKAKMGGVHVPQITRRRGPENPRRAHYDSDAGQGATVPLAGQGEEEA